MKNLIEKYTYKAIICNVITFILILCSCSNADKKVENNVYLENTNVRGLSVTDLRKIISNYESNINTDPKNASVEPEKWEIVPESYGRKVNVERTLEMILNSGEGDKVNLVVEDIKPDITTEILKGEIVEISSFSTTLLDRQANRVDNIEIAADSINCEKIMPGEEFSFNGVLGRRTGEKGYKKAPIIIKTENGPKKSYGGGGGICQLSTTIYNAALKANLEITERHPHSKKVSYVPEGNDAAVAYGSSDLRFKNNRQYPLIIKVNLSNKKLTVKIYENRSNKAV